MKHRSIAKAIGKNYKTVEDHKHMGLDNKICRDRKYFCKCHNVWLSEEDVKKKHCKNKPDLHMIGTNRCEFLVEYKQKRDGTPTVNVVFPDSNKEGSFL